MKHSCFFIALFPEIPVNYTCTCIELIGSSLKPYHFIKRLIVTVGYHILHKPKQLVCHSLTSWICFQKHPLNHPDFFHIFITCSHCKCFYQTCRRYGFIIDGELLSVLQIFHIDAPVPFQIFRKFLHSFLQIFDPRIRQFLDTAIFLDCQALWCSTSFFH